jgi:alpha-beta hydrolase superfamily lysophospholipase
MSAEATAVSRDARLDDRARWFRSGDDWCVAHWHAAQAPVLRRVAILCPSLGSERMRGERAFRVLADRLASRGVGTLRFDYPATGNSTGDALDARETEPDLVARWCRSIVDAMAHATQRMPGAEVVLVGRRLGALLVMEATRSMTGTANRCVLWDPPASGRSMVRELRLREQARFDHRYADELAREHPAIALQWEGHRFDRRTVEAIERLALNELSAAVERVEVVANDPRRAVAALARATGSDESTRVAGHSVADAAFDWSVYDGPALPDECLAVIERCVVAGAPLASEDDARRDEPQVPRVVRHGGERSVLEELVRFGPVGALFGVSTTRASGGAVAKTAALILPTGIEPSSGYGDMWARFARRAAVQGVPSLRVDWRGNGESAPHPGGPENVSYGLRRTDDVGDGVAWLRGRFPGASIVVVGLCSGGYYAVHATAEGAGADRVIAINPQLYWHEGMPATLGLDDLAPAVEMQLADGLERAVGDGRKWRRLLRGGYHWRDVLRAARGVAARRGWLPSPGNGDSGLLGGRLPRIDLERIFPGPARTHLVYSDDDFGLPHLQAHGHAAYTALMARPHMRLHLLEGCDHNYSRESMRARLEPLLLEILAEH